ncbi:MAG: outer membrane protein assembly factor BamB family protein, partial [Planctomycetota bacterium]
REGGKWSKVVKPVPEHLDEWTHYLRDASNNATGQDPTVGPPRSMQWMATPVWSRHHDKLASISSVVTTKGRVFYIVDRGPTHTPNYKAQWFVEARDAFNGVFLWRQSIKSWVSHTKGFRSGPVQIARLLVAVEDRVYAALGINEPVSVLDAATGEIVRTLEGTGNVEEIAVDGSRLFALVGEESAEHAFMKGADFKKKFLVGMDPETGRRLWRWPEGGSADIFPRSLAAREGAVYFQEGLNTIRLDAATGKERWKTSLGQAKAPAKPAPAPAKGKRRKGRGKPKGRAPGWVFNNLVVSHDMVLSCDGNKMWALSAADGKVVWECPAKTPFGRTPSVDVFVIGDIVWTSPSLSEGRDIRTGEIVKKLDLKSTLTTAGHHHRCYRNKASGDFILYAHRGTDFYDTKGDRHARNNWVRGVCQYGVMPANGLLYAPSHNCGCYSEAILHGFWALSHEGVAADVPDSFRGSLQRGRASPGAPAAGETDWPTYRGDAGRTGCAPSELPSKLKQSWQVEVGGSLTAPVIGDGLVVLARKDNHTVYALDKTTGKERWSFTAGGVVDSPPTLHAGRALFGASDGKVYCLALSDGKPLWRFNAAPSPHRTVAMGNVESLWPVSGSVTVKNGVAYFVSGRSTYLDGGLFLFGLDALTGEVRHTGRLKGEYPGRMENKSGTPAKGITQNKTDYKTFDHPDRSDAFSMWGNVSDVMVADSESVYLRHMRFNDDLTANPEWKHHLFSTSKLLDEHEAHRSHWFYGNGDFSRLPVAYEWITRNKYGGYNAPFGRLLVYDSDTVWGVNGNGQSYQLFASDVRGFDEKMKKNFPSSKGKPGPARIWTQSMPMHPRAMLKAGGSIFIGCAEDSEQLVTKRPGGKILVMSAADGQKTGEVSIGFPPVFDGMAAAGGKLFLSATDGKVTCFGGP